MKKTILSFFSLFILVSLQAEPVVRDQSNLTIPSKIIGDYLTSWIGNDGGTQKSHIPHTIENLFVRGDGLVASICKWDEGGTNVGVYQDGKVVCVPVQSGTGSWGRNSGLAVAMDDNYVYQLMTQSGGSGTPSPNINGLSTYPISDPNLVWHVVRRYNVKTGEPAPFPSGYGYAGDMLLVTDRSAHQLVGLAINNFSEEIFVAMKTEAGSPNYIRVYDKSTMNGLYTRQFRIEDEVGLIALDNDWGFWMKKGNKLVRYSQLNGNKLGQEITFPENTVIHSFGIDAKQGKIYLANSGRDLNVLVYSNIYTTPVFSGTIGTTGGFLTKTDKYKKGEAGPLRFIGPTGVGTDDAGNIYVSSTAVGGYGAVLEAYSPDLKMLWKAEGLLFTAVGDFHPSDSTIFYTPEKIHKIDYMKMGHRMDELVAYTHDPFSFPDDPRNPDNGIFVTSSFARELGGKVFTFISDMYGSMLSGYRYDEATHGYTGVPFMSVGASGNQINLWVDENGDGLRQSGEVTGTGSVGGSSSHYIDQAGNIWRGCEHEGFGFWEFNGLNAKGWPTWKAYRHFSLPKGITTIRRIYYLPDRDELLLSGFSNEKPGGGGGMWWCMGSTILKFNNAMSLLNGATPPANWNANLSLYIPYEDNTENPRNSKSFAANDNLIFISLGRNGYVLIYNSETGDYVGLVRPGAEVGGASGWSDFNYCINVRKNKDNTYSILIEENAFAKSIFYDLYGFNEAPTRLGDLIPVAESETFKNAQNEAISPTDVGIGQPVYFGITVRNRVNNSIAVVTQYTRYNAARCIVQFTVQDAATGEIVYTGYSKAHEANIGALEEFILSSEEPFIPGEKGSYLLTVDVNYGPYGREANYNNNTLTANFSAQTVGLGSYEADNILQVYPNPAIDVIHVKGIGTNGGYKIIDLMGKTRQSNSSYNGESIHVASLPAGVYFLQSANAVVKFIKE